ncbi:MAG: hypothetical protein M3P98_03875 [bacterium]|nr:hypothetical protein [bacterium]
MPNPQLTTPEISHHPRIDFAKIGRRLLGAVALIGGLYFFSDVMDVDPNLRSTVDEMKLVGGAALAFSGSVLAFTDQDITDKKD